MGKVKEYLVNKVFWTGMIIGFTLGACIAGLDYKCPFEIRAKRSAFT